MPTASKAGLRRRGAHTISGRHRCYTRLEAFRRYDSLAPAVAARCGGIVCLADTANTTTEHEPLGRVPAWLLWQEAALIGNLVLRTRTHDG
jgi:hypothetical protein